MTALYSHTTRAAGTLLTASIYNADHQNHINNGVPAQLDDYSTSVAEMQTTSDPGEVGTENQATNLAGEIERLRFAILELKQKLDDSITQWYQTPIPSETSGRPPLPAWYIEGLDYQVFPSNPGFVFVATGWCRSADDTVNLKVSTPKHRSVSSLWVSNATGGGMGVTFTLTRQLAYVFVFKTQASGYDIGFDTALTASNLMAKASATAYRRIGTVFAPTILNQTVQQVISRAGNVIFTGTSVINNAEMQLIVSGPTTPFLVSVPLVPTGFPVRVELGVNMVGLPDGGAVIFVGDFWMAGNFTNDHIVFPSTNFVGFVHRQVWTGPCGDFYVKHEDVPNNALATSVGYSCLGYYDLRRGSTG